MRYSQEKEYVSFVFYCLENLSIAVTLEPMSDLGGIQENATSPNENFNQIEN